ncbi:helix-turn-helix domain-containing protein [Paenibacillus cremeus]|uniref:Helix-turn-helix domain-containing protein n=1 Tax=Paenibacillus cremeus TaxID=2163881 RepID=A0A559KAQ5_9BACL|nr:helix-turn-helix domain-containing protein [Paenibacillus cremeus]TVY09205.1 helix-turn-helix domain-containing protein [Paenibacillus cremeus]
MKSNYFNRLVCFACLSVCLPIMLAGFVYYQYSMKGGIVSLQENNETSLGMIEQFTEKIMRDMVDRSFQLALDPSVAESFNAPDYSNDYVSQMELLRKMSLEKYQNKLIGEIYYYNRSAGLVLSTDAGHQPLESFRYKADIEKLEQDATGGQWVYLPTGQANGFLSFALRLPTLASGEAQGWLVTQADVAQINKYISGVYALASSQTMVVLDEQHRPLFQMTKAYDFKRYVNGSILQAITSGSSKDGHALKGTDAEGESFFYSYKKSTSGNVYISILPYRLVMEKLSGIRWTTLIAVLALLAVGILLALITLRRAYNPIRQFVDYLTKEKARLGEQLDRSVPPLIERLLQQWLAGTYSHRPTLFEESRKYGIPVDGIYVTLLVKVENLLKETRFKPEDKPILMFAVTNIMNELLAGTPQVQGYVLHDHQGQGTAILYFKRNTAQADMMAQTMQFAQSIQASIRHYLKLRVSVGIGKFYPHIADLHISYQEAKLALQYRLCKEEETILCIGELEEMHKQTAFRYPRSIEQSIVEALSIGNLPEARAALQQFIQALQPSGSFAISSQSCCMLLAAIIASLEDKGGRTPEMLEYNLFDQLRTRETRAEMCEWFNEMLFPLYEKIADDNYNKSGKLIAQKASKYIMDNVSREISLAECADSLRITPAYLSRVFKKEFGWSFLDYVTECKMNEARRLLSATDQNISQIAQAIGYSHRTFNRVFQRMLKMSPSDYRTQYR